MHALGRTSAVVASLAAFAFASPASAADSSADNAVQTGSERITYGDLDLSTRQGARALIRRIERAADRLCTPPGPPPLAGPGAEDLECRERAIERAVVRLGSDQVDTEYAALER